RPSISCSASSSPAIRFSSRWARFAGGRSRAKPVVSVAETEVDLVDQGVAGEPALEVVCQQHMQLVEDLAGGRRAVGRQVEVGGLPQRVVRRERLAAGDVE